MTYTNSSTKHVTGTLVATMTKNKRNYVQAYYSPAQKKVMFVYDIPSGTKANVNKMMSTDSSYSDSYTLPNFDLTGFKLIILVDYNTNKVIHAEVRYGAWATKQIEHLRYQNKMIMQIFPIYSIDKKYEGTSPGGAGEEQTKK